MIFRKFIFKILRQIKFFRDWREGVNFTNNTFFPAGHFYSPIVSLKAIKFKESQIWEDFNLEGIELHIQEQLNLLKQLAIYYPEMPYGIASKKFRYQINNNYYAFNDGIILHLILRHFKPSKVIEIGSGYSSSVMLDTNELFFNNSIELTFIEPFPDRLLSQMTAEDKINSKLIIKEVQSIPLKIFQDLHAGDILFIDSSHIVKTASDVNHIIFKILPVLKQGVLIHFHDIFYPFEYPKKWVYKGLNWNEVYFIKAFLMYNQQFKILFFSDYLHKFHPNAFANMPLTYHATGSNLWLIKSEK